jgi:pimeloyl-ACP methyl ester carboxylesterase
MGRLLHCAGVALLLSLSAEAPPSLDRSIPVPLDYSHASLGSARLTYELGAPFDRTKATVFVIADGQQFYVQKGAMAALQQKLFGPEVNVVGIVTRGTTPAFIKAALGPDGKPDWQRAWTIFNSNQWIGDIERVRRAVVGRATIMLYGRSGGAYLVHQYVAQHGDHVSRAFTQSPVNPQIIRQLHISLDNFWSTLSRQSPELQPVLLDALERRPEEHTRILLTLQRQHFYVPDDQLKTERERLIRAFASGDNRTYAQFRKDYEVDGVIRLLASRNSVPQVVRVMELIGPTGAFDQPNAPVSPLIGPQRDFARELIALEKAGKIALPTFDLAALHRARAEVFILAARDDEAVDYRTSIALAYSYPHSVLFIARDNHNFANISRAGADAKLIQSFFVGGIGSKRLNAALVNAEQFRWSD